MFNLYAAEQLGKIRQAEALHHAEVEQLRKLSQSNGRARPNTLRSLIVAALNAARVWRARPVTANIALAQNEQPTPC